MNWDIALPILILIVTTIVVVLLWYWWSSSRGPGPEGQYPLEDDTQQKGWMRYVALEAGTLRKLREWARSVFPAVAARLTVASPSGVTARQTGELVETVRLFRDLATGGLVVEIGGRRYFGLSEMTDDTVRRRFIGVAESVAQFASGVMPTPAPYIPPPQASLSSAPAPAALQPTAEPTATGKQGEKAPKVVLKTVAEEIEELLQYRLTLTPEHSHRSIHIRESHGGAITVEVDGHYYDGIGEVADETVRSFLQDIVREWEARK